MLKLRFTRNDQIVASAGTALICSILTQYLSSKEDEGFSETLCWIILPVLLAIARRKDASSRSVLSSDARDDSSSLTSLWIVSTCITGTCCYKAEIGMIVLFPALTPLLLTAEKHLVPDIPALNNSNLSLLSSLFNSIWGTTLVTLFAIFCAADWDLQRFALSTIPLATLVLTYIAFIPKRLGTHRFIPHVNVQDDVGRLSWRIVLLLFITLSVQTYAFGLPSNDIKLSLLLGLTKATSWFFTIRRICITLPASNDLDDNGRLYISWGIATSIATFSIASTVDPFAQFSELQAMSQIIVSAIALGQIIYMLPRRAKARAYLWWLILVAVVPYLANSYAIRNAQTSAPKWPSLPQKHPVEALTHNAKADFEQLLQKQSTTYAAAVGEYQHRYGVDPPLGFEAWYDYATANHSPVIDEFDMIFEQVSPFLRLSGKEVITAMADVQNVSNTDLWNCKLSGSSAETQCSHPQHRFDRHVGLLFNSLLANLSGVLPDVNFLLNNFDQPRVLIPPPSRQEEHLHVDGSGDYRVLELSRRPTWDAITKFCTAEQRKIVQDEHEVEKFGLPFVTDRFSAMDLCQHSEYSSMHGLLVNPTSFSLIEGLVPILSTSSPSTMGDVLFPSPAYIEDEFRYDERRDVEWDRKRNKVYWAGSTTGGWATDTRWRYFHRQRFVNLAQNLDRGRQHQYLREAGGEIKSARSSFLNGRLYDVALTKIVGCERKYCREQRAYFRVKSWADRDQPLQSRLVFDVDGNGISGRFYKLLASRSAVLKQTLLREWHDERLIPWVHYIPISQSMEEVPELIFYLTSTTDGQRRAREIADQGRDWFVKAFRDVDLSIYIYRLVLELARIQDPDREAIAV